MFMIELSKMQRLYVFIMSDLIESVYAPAP